MNASAFSERENFYQTKNFPTLCYDVCKKLDEKYKEVGSMEKDRFFFCDRKSKDFK